MSGRKAGENGSAPEGLDGAEKETRVTGSGRGEVRGSVGIVVDQRTRIENNLQPARLQVRWVGFGPRGNFIQPRMASDQSPPLLNLIRCGGLENLSGQLLYLSIFCGTTFIWYMIYMLLETPPASDRVNIWMFSPAMQSPAHRKFTGLETSWGGFQLILISLLLVLGVWCVEWSTSQCRCSFPLLDWPPGVTIENLDFSTFFEQELVHFYNTGVWQNILLPNFDAW